jgi:hypothetical protein
VQPSRLLSYRLSDHAEQPASDHPDVFYPVAINENNVHGRATILGSIADNVKLTHREMLDPPLLDPLRRLFDGIVDKNGGVSHNPYSLGLARALSDAQRQRVLDGARRTPPDGDER